VVGPVHGKGRVRWCVDLPDGIVLRGKNGSGAIQDTYGGDVWFRRRLNVQSRLRVHGGVCVDCGGGVWMDEVGHTRPVRIIGPRVVVVEVETKTEKRIGERWIVGR
jgi:hypothetical protein